VQGFIDSNGPSGIGIDNTDVYVYDRVTGANQLISHVVNSGSTGGDFTRFDPQISGDGPMRMI
jgi:hypothetical protein